MDVPKPWHEVWMEVARVIAQRSKDPSTKVGAVLVSPDQRQVATGYNGFPKGIVENRSRWERPAKYDYVVHAEQNAILNCVTDVSGWTLYCTLFPCKQCAKMIAQTGLDTVVVPANIGSKFSEIDTEFAEQIFKEANVKLVRI